MRSLDLMAASPSSTSSEHTSNSLLARRKSRVSAEHTLSRVRENQRRHRARQRDYVACLEQKLAETEQLLAEARAEIATLKAEQAAADAMYRLTHIKPMDPSSQRGLSADSILAVEEASLDKHSELASMPTSQSVYPHIDIPDLSFLSDAISPKYIEIISGTQLSLSFPLSETVERLGGPPPCCSDSPSTPPPDELADPECSTCKTRPPPDPSESTTLCAQAFIIISQQNFRNLDPETIRIWLAQGLRRAQREGEGCRVENGALLRLLDYISGM